MYVIKLKLSLPDKEKIGRFAIRTIRLLLICGRSVIENFKPLLTCYGMKRGVSSKTPCKMLLK